MTKMVDLLREVDFAPSDQIHSAFKYRENDRSKRMKESLQVVQEFFEGKFDPKKLDMRKKVQKRLKKKKK